MFFLHKLIHHSVPFSGLFTSSCLLTTLSLPHPPPLPQTCTHRVSSNLAACPWVHTVTKAHFSSLFRCCALVLAAKLCHLLQLVFLCQHKMHCQCRINYLTTCEPPTLFSSLFSISLCSGSGNQNTDICLPYRHCTAVLAQILPFSDVTGMTVRKSSAWDVSWNAQETPIETVWVLLFLSYFSYTFISDTVLHTCQIICSYSHLVAFIFTRVSLALFPFLI